MEVKREVKRKVLINSGHHSRDMGVTQGNHKESYIVMSIRDRIKKYLPDALYVPDHLNLKDSIVWVNERADEGDLAVEIHLNANKNVYVRGTEAYYDDRPEIADLFARKISSAMKIPNAGAKHDSLTHVGSLGWLRHTKCSAVLIELCYLTNGLDRKAILLPEGEENAARGVVEAINTQLQITKAQKTLVELLKQLYQWLLNKK